MRFFKPLQFNVLKIKLCCGDLTVFKYFFQDPGSRFGIRIRSRRPLNPDPKHCLHYPRYQHVDGNTYLQTYFICPVSDSIVCTGPYGARPRGNSLICLFCSSPYTAEDYQRHLKPHQACARAFYN